MFPLSLTTGYAVLALNCLEAPGGEPVQVASVAATMGLPGPFLSKIVNRLAVEGLVKTRRGRCGGVTLAREASNISLEEIVRAVDGENWDKGCFLGLRTCRVPEGRCPLHQFWLDQIEVFRARMASVSLADLGCFNPIDGVPDPNLQCCPANCSKAEGGCR